MATQTLVQLKRKSEARGTATVNVRDRQIRVLPLGARPGNENDSGEINIEEYDGVYVVSKPGVGALSTFDTIGLLAFHIFMLDPADKENLINYYTQFGDSPDSAALRADNFVAQMVLEGWTRTAPPEVEDLPLRAVYFTVTRACDLACPYCYQGLANRTGTEMPVEMAALALDRIRAVNPQCNVIVTGGEAFSHSRIFEILQLIEDRQMRFIILTNGTYITEEIAQRIKSFSCFDYIQVSLDGITPETHERTRGKGHFPKVMSAINSIIANELPFVLAPTLHEGNMHEMPQIAELALAHGGYFSPNQLKEFPHAGLDYTNLTLSTGVLTEAIKRINLHMIDKFSLELVAERNQRYAGPEVCSVMAPNSTFICGMAHSLVDIDWNGDVYPCHLTKDEKLMIGNVFREDFDKIFRTVEQKGLRVKSYEIEGCSSCKFVSNCGGGCRAGAWFTYGTLQHKDELCEANYSSQLRKLLAGIH